MAGGIFAGHDESGGELIERGGVKYKMFYGMSSTTAMTKHAGGVANYRSSEGKTVEIKYRGPVEVTMRDILGGLRSACTYVGAATLKEMPRRTTFIRCTQQLNPVFNTSKDVSEKPTLDSSEGKEGKEADGDAKRARHG
jgi:GMP reductase